MKIPLGGGAYIEPDPEPRDSQWHKKIVSVTAVPDEFRRVYIDLECGHRFIGIGNPAHAEGRVLCTQCRDAAEAR